MPSTFSWLDFSEADRQQTMQVLDLFREKNTLDELGFAPIRDAFADHFFPGTSTIQTRARYFLFVSWIMQRNAKKGLSGPDFLSRLRSNETKLMKALVDGDPDQNGIIGREAKGTLKRMPSAVYWRGLSLWGIRRFEGSIDQYARQLHRRNQQSGNSLVTDDGEPVSGPPPLWSPGLPPEPDGFLDRVSFELTEVESRFLTEQICSTQPRSVLSQLLMGATAPINSDWIWDSKLQPLLTPRTRLAIEFARRFAICAWGGSLVYTRQVARLKGGCEQLIDAVDVQLQAWQQQLKREASVLHEWDLHQFWSLVQEINPRLTGPTRQFADEWIAVSRQVATGTPAWLEPRVEILLRRREERLKGNRARLCRENLRGRDRWRGNAASSPMDYRWSQTRMILNDILALSTNGPIPAENAEGKSHA